MAAKAQQEPQLPWLRMGGTLPCALKSYTLGRVCSSLRAALREALRAVTVAVRVSVSQPQVMLLSKEVIRRDCNSVSFRSLQAGKHASAKWHRRRGDLPCRRGRAGGQGRGEPRCRACLVGRVIGRRPLHGLARRPAAAQAACLRPRQFRQRSRGGVQCRLCTLNRAVLWLHPRDPITLHESCNHASIRQRSRSRCEAMQWDVRPHMHSHNLRLQLPRGLEACDAWFCADKRAVKTHTQEPLAGSPKPELPSPVPLHHGFDSSEPSQCCT